MCMFNINSIHVGNTADENPNKKTMKSNTRTRFTRALQGSALTLAAAASFALALPGQAQDAAAEPSAETVAAAKQLLVTLEVKKTLEPALAGVKQMQSAMIEQQNLTPEQKDAAADIMAASMEEVEKLLAWDNLEAMMIRIYSKVFSAEEITALIKLFESPTGQAYVKKQPELQAATMMEMQKMMVDLIPTIQAKTQEAVERARAANPKN